MSVRGLDVKVDQRMLPLPSNWRSRLKAVLEAVAVRGGFALTAVT